MGVRSVASADLAALGVPMVVALTLAVLGVLATMLINDALVGTFFSVSSAQKATLARHLAGVELLFDNLASPGNVARVGLWLGALGMLVLMRPPRGSVLVYPVFHLGLAVFLAMHATASFLRDW